MNTRARLKIDFAANQARSIHRIISPDNTPLPPGIHLKSRIIENSMELTVICERGIGSLWSTLEDIMSAIDVGIKTLREMKPQS